MLLFWNKANYINFNKKIIKFSFNKMNILNHNESYNFPEI